MYLFKLSGLTQLLHGIQVEKPKKKKEKKQGTGEFAFLCTVGYGWLLGSLRSFIQYFLLLWQSGVLLELLNALVFFLRFFFLFSWAFWVVAVRMKWCNQAWGSIVWSPWAGRGWKTQKLGAMTQMVFSSLMFFLGLQSLMAAGQSQNENMVPFYTDRNTITKEISLV